MRATSRRALKAKVIHEIASPTHVVAVSGDDGYRLASLYTAKSTVRAAFCCASFVGVEGFSVEIG